MAQGTPVEKDDEGRSGVLSMRAKATIFGAAFLSCMVLIASWSLPHLVSALQDLGLGGDDGEGDNDPTDTRYEPVLVWSKAYTTGCPGFIAKRDDGTYCITGEKCRQLVSPKDPKAMFKDWDIYAARIDSDGNLTWDRTLGRQTFAPNQTQQWIQEWMIWEGPRDVVSVGDGYLILAWGYDGFSEAPWNQQLNSYLYKIDTNGQEVWRKVYGGDLWENPVELLECKDGGFLIAGNSFTVKNSWEKMESMWYSGVEYTDVFMLKTDRNGEAVWWKIYDTGGTNWIGRRSSKYTVAYNMFIQGVGIEQGSSCIVPGTEGGYIVAGSTSPFYLMKPSETANIYVFAIDEHGDKRWEKEYPGSDYYAATCIVQSTDGGYIIAGERMTPGPVIEIPEGVHRGEQYLEPGETYTYVMKIDREGNQIWNRTLWLGGMTNDLAPTHNGGCIGISSKAVFELDSDGDFIWDWICPDIDGKPGALSSITPCGERDFLALGWKVDEGAVGACGTSLYAFKITPGDTGNGN